MYKLMFSLIVLIIGYFSFFTLFYIINLTNYYYWSFLPAIIILIIFIPFILKHKVTKIEYDNKFVYKNFLSKKYWQEAFSEVKKLKNLVMMAALLSLTLITKLLTLPSGFGDLGISFGYVFLAIGGLLYGPVAGMLMGFLVDNLEFIIFPSAYPYFIGYSISSMLTGLINGLLFYKTKLSFFKIFTNRLLVNFFINAILGTIWMGIVANYHNLDMYFTRFLFIALPKNLVYLIPQSLILFAVFKSLAHVFVRADLMAVEVKENIGLF